MDVGNGLALLGRVEEYRRLVDMVAVARAGHSGSVVVRGEAGIGKTVLLEQLAADAEGMRVLRAQGVEFESELAYSTLYELVRPILGLLDELPAVQARALRVALALGGEGPVNRLA